MKKRKYFIGFILCCILIIMAKKLQQSKIHSVVLPAIDKLHANGMLEEGKAYIVQVHYDRDDYNFGTFYFYEEDGEQKPIVLINKEPRDELSYVFMEPKRNKFLVQGYVEAEWSELNGYMVFYVEKWYLVKPIKRDYGSKDYRTDWRFFSPKSYIDKFDLESGDYTPIYD